MPAFVRKPNRHPGEPPCPDGAQQRMKMNWATIKLHLDNQTQNRRITMAPKDDNAVVEVMHPICCGVDVHKETISACLIKLKGDRLDFELKEFGCFTDDLLRFKNWLLENNCPIVAMESTGVYWRPVHNILEDCLSVLLVNARHIKNVPGRKTDLKDCKWLAGLLRLGLLQGSFIPPRFVRDWRDLTRTRKTIVDDIADYKRRVHKLFETANIKIDSVASDLFSVTGRNLMKKLVKKPHLELFDIKECARGSLKKKARELHRSVQGDFRAHHAFILESLLRIIDHLDKELARINSKLGTLMCDYEQVIERLDQVPGINTIAAQTILSEIGPTLETFRSSSALCSWAGLCPGNNESAGKRFPGKSPVRKHHLKTILIETAWAAIKTKGSFYKTKYYAAKSRLGAKRAITAIAHKILKVIYLIIKEGQRYTELGEDFHLRKRTTAIYEKLSKQATKLGYRLVPATIND
jgi:transposase